MKRNWAVDGVSALAAAPLLLLIGGAILALVVATSPQEVVKQIHEDAVRDALWLSLKTTVVSLAIILICGTAIARLICRSHSFTSGALELLVTLPAILPPSVAGIALLLAFGREGLIGKYFDQAGITFAFTPTAVVMAQVFVATPFYVREAAAAMQALDPNIVDAAKVDGASRWQVSRFVALPLALPFFVGGAALAWARALGEFGATILFAGSMQGVTQTAPLAIYLGFESNLDQAKALGVILLVCATAVLIFVRLLLRRQLAVAH